MALGNLVRRKLGYALASHGAADDLADIIDAGSGTLAADTKRRIHVALGNAAADQFISDAENGTAIDGFIQNRLKIALADAGMAQQIATEMDS